MNEPISVACLRGVRSFVLFAVVGAYYYLRVVKLMYFDEPVSGEAKFVAKLTPEAGVLLTVNGLLIVAIMPWIGFIADACENAILLLGI